MVGSYTRAGQRTGRDREKLALSPCSCRSQYPVWCAFVLVLFRTTRCRQDKKVLTDDEGMMAYVRNSGTGVRKIQ